MQHKNEYRKSIDGYRPISPVRRKIGLYWFLAVLRIALTFVPQTGYIHPDEYFQSIEVISGDRFDIDVYKPWEFNSTFPIRTAFIMQLVVGLPYSILNTISPYTLYYLSVYVKTPYILVLLPRLVMCALSFVSDLCLYRICCMYGQNYKIRLITFASSYVVLTYATRVFSNSIELLLTSLLLYYTSQCMTYSEKIIVRSDYLSDRYDEARNGVERVKYYKLKASLPQHSLNHCFKIATITVTGVFNRPTFVAFAFPPIFFWLQRGLGSKSVGLVDFHVRMFTFLLYGLPTIIFFILADSFYFGYLTLAEIAHLEVGMNSFVVTPLNFLRYNTKTENLSSHGLHPRFLHFLVNVPLLFNVLGIIGLFTFAKMLRSGLKGRWLDLPRIQSIVGLMTASFIVPIALLSVFPHQEPRFLLPVILPLVFLYSPNINHVPGLDIVPVLNNNNNNTYHRYTEKPKRSKLLIAWYICNIALTFFYGFVHQGGVLPLTSHMAAELKAKPELTHVHLYTSYTYSMPTALLQLRNTRRIYMSSSKHKYKLARDFYLYEQGSRSVKDVCDNIALKLRECEETFNSKRIPYRLYYAIPATAFDEFVECSLNNQSRAYSYHVIASFYPHVSTEKLLSPAAVSGVVSLTNVATNSIAETANSVSEFFQQYRLLLIRIQMLVSKRKARDIF